MDEKRSLGVRYVMDDMGLFGDMNRFGKTKEMSKEEAMQQVKELFAENNFFISHCDILIAATNKFDGIREYDLVKDSYEWEALYSLTIQFKYWDSTEEILMPGFKTIRYRKGNKNHDKNGKIHDMKIAVFAEGKPYMYDWKLVVID